MTHIEALRITNILDDDHQWYWMRTPEGRASLFNRAILALNTAAKMQAALNAGTWTDRHDNGHPTNETERNQAPAKILKLVRLADAWLTLAVSLNSREVGGDGI